MREKQETRNWPELAAGLYDQLTGRGSEIAYDMQNLEVQIPSGTGPEATHAKWIVNGVLKIRTRDQANG
jgi:hypothetical protein